MRDNKKKDIETIILQYDYMKRESAEAWLLAFSRKKAWLAKSICDIDTKNATIEVPQWLAEKYGIEMYEV